MLIDDFSSQMLDADYWQHRGEVVGTAQGRGTTYFIQGQHQQAQWVLRHYYRGGLIGKLIKDNYFYHTMAKTRAFQEFALLVAMGEKGLPAPQPVACRVIKSGLSYQADLLTSRIENASDLVDILQGRTLDAAQWHAIGQVIAQFHQAGIYHHDLNAHNILIDKENKVWLIDFDRGEVRKNIEGWPQSNVSRLLRSFNKEKNKLPTFYWTPENWQQLLSGYQAIK